VEDYDARRISTRARAAIRRYAPPGSAYEDDATEVANSPAGDQCKAQQFTAIVHALRDVVSAKPRAQDMRPEDRHRKAARPTLAGWWR